MIQFDHQLVQNLLLFLAFEGGAATRAGSNRCLSMTRVRISWLIRSWDANSLNLMDPFV